MLHPPPPCESPPPANLPGPETADRLRMGGDRGGRRYRRVGKGVVALSENKQKIIRSKRWAVSVSELTGWLS